MTDGELGQEQSGREAAHQHFPVLFSSLVLSNLNRNPWFLIRNSKFREVKYWVGERRPRASSTTMSDDESFSSPLESTVGFQLEPESSTLHSVRKNDQGETHRIVITHSENVNLSANFRTSTTASLEVGQQL